MKKARKTTKRTAPEGNVLTTLPVAMTGRASPAKAAVGDNRSLPTSPACRSRNALIAERVDALAAKKLPGLQRCVKWGMAWYGVGDGWCFSCGGFAGHVKLTFGRGTALTPVPPADADRDGQGLARRRPRIRRRPRRAPGGVVDATGRGHPRLRTEDTRLAALGREAGITSRRACQLLGCLDEQAQRRRSPRDAREVEEEAGNRGGVPLEDDPQPPSAELLDHHRLQGIHEPQVPARRERRSTGHRC